MPRQQRRDWGWGKYCPTRVGDAVTQDEGVAHLGGNGGGLLLLLCAAGLGGHRCVQGGLSRGCTVLRFGWAWRCRERGLCPAAAGPARARGCRMKVWLAPAGCSSAGSLGCALLPLSAAHPEAAQWLCSAPAWSELPLHPMATALPSRLGQQWQGIALASSTAVPAQNIAWCSPTQIGGDPPPPRCPQTSGMQRREPPPHTNLCAPRMSCAFILPSFPRLGSACLLRCQGINLPPPFLPQQIYQTY